jgi:hypothetical protein
VFDTPFAIRKAACFVCAGRIVAVSSQGGALFQYFGVAGRYFASAKKPLISGAKRPARSIFD